MTASAITSWSFPSSTALALARHLDVPTQPPAKGDPLRAYSIDRHQVVAIDARDLADGHHELRSSAVSS